MAEPSAEPYWATLTSAAALGVLVLVRTFLSFSLEIELEGSLPWRRRAAGPDSKEVPGSE